MSFFVRKSFLILVLLLLKPPVVFAAPSVWDFCKRFFRSGAFQTVASSNTVIQKGNSDSAKGDTLRILLIRHASTLNLNEESSMDRSEIIRIAREQSFFSPTPLSSEGAEKFEKKCVNLKDYSFDLLIHSPTMRAWQTAQIFLKYFPIGKVEKIIEVDEEGESYSYDRFFDTIKTHQAKSVVLVHHLPFLHSFLMNAHRSSDFRIGVKGGMVLLEFPYPYDPGSARIVEMESK